MISYSCENVKMPAIKKRDTTAWIRRVAATYNKKVGEVGYLFCDDEHILEVNREYLGHDYYTDIITFDYCEDDVLNGDLVISLDTVRVSTTRDQGSARSWKPQKTKRWNYCNSSNAFFTTSLSSLKIEKYSLISHKSRATSAFSCSLR